VEPGGVIMANTRLDAPNKSGRPPAANVRVPSGRPDDGGITIINIDTRPPNARTITDHVAVLTPNAWLMPGHYAGLLNTQTLGDYVLDHSYVWEERVLNEDLPPWVPIPTLPRCKMRSRRQRKISRASPVMT